jgi:hypothetical protein
MSRTFFHCVALRTFFATAVSWAPTIPTRQPDEFHRTVEAARGWLKAKPADRANFEADLKEDDGY